MIWPWDYTQVAIADELGRSASTISRELRRNRGKRGWRARQPLVASNSTNHMKGLVQKNVMFP